MTVLVREAHQYVKVSLCIPVAQNCNYDVSWKKQSLSRQLTSTISVDIGDFALYYGGIQEPLVRNAQTALSLVLRSLIWPTRSLHRSVARLLSIKLYETRLGTYLKAVAGIVLSVIGIL